MLNTVHDATGVEYYSTLERDQMQTSTNGQSGSPTIKVITGAAGTGKTTAIRAIIKEFRSTGRQFVLVAPTNRAAKILRSEHKLPATTIHKSLYRSVKTDDYTIVMKPVIDETTGRPKTTAQGETIYFEDEQPVWEFVFNPLLDSNFTIIIDESSMVPSNVWDDIMKNFGGEIIMVGDQNQLQPVEIGDAVVPEYVNFFSQVAQQPDCHLGGNEQNKRLSEDAAGIHAVIDHVCSAKTLHGAFPNLQGSEGYNYIDLRSNTEIAPEIRMLLNTISYGEDSAIICWTNLECDFVNRLVRKDHAEENNRRYTEYPVVGDRLIAECAYTVEDDAGDSVQIVTKGDELIIKEITKVDAKNNIMWVRVADIKQFIPLSVAHITGERVPKKVKVVRWVYGYAMTCHKAQGSGWPTVVIVDSHCRPDDGRRWRYTAATRARTKLIVIKTGIGFDKRTII